MSTPVLAAPGYPLWRLVRYFLYLGAAGFGGPVALVEYMHRDLVGRNRWITDEEYREGLALANLSPGPLAAQLAIYIGFVHYRFLGASLVAMAFVLPSFVMIVFVGWAYVEFGGLDWMQAVFYGVGAAIIGIITQSAYRLTRKTISADPLLWIIFLVMAAVTAITETERIELFPLAGFAVWIARRRTFPRQPHHKSAAALLPFPLLLQTAASPAGAGLGTIFWFFFGAGAFVFGSGLAIVPFLYGGVVGGYGWLTDQQFLDAVAVALITPGPVVITTGFIGYLVAGLPGAVIAAIATFLPAYLLTVFPAPYFRKYGRRPAILAVVDGVTAAAIGAITGAVIVLGQRALTDVTTALLAIAALALLAKSPRRIPEPVIVALAAIAGLLLYPGAG